MGRETKSSIPKKVTTRMPHRDDVQMKTRNNNRTLQFGFKCELGYFKYPFTFLHSMEITVFIERSDLEKTVALPEGATVEDLLSRLHLNPETVLTVRDNTVLLQDHSLRDKDFIKILSVVSGG